MDFGNFLWIDIKYYIFKATTNKYILLSIKIFILLLSSIEYILQKHVFKY